MTLVNKLKKHGYHQAQYRNELFVKEFHEFYINISLSDDMKKISKKRITYAYDDFVNQNEIDNLQIAFNIMNNDIKEKIMNDRTYDYYLIKGNEVIDLGPEAHFAFMHSKAQTPFEYEDVAQIKIDGRKFEEQFKKHKKEK